jgi:stringent starvation protein B
MQSTKPYLMRAIYEWCADQGFTPYLTVHVDAHTRVPKEFVRNGEITLNIGAEATHQMLMGNEEVTFHARFNGVSFPVVIPIEAVSAIFARENGQGMAFEVLPVEAREKPVPAEGTPGGATAEIAPAPEDGDKTPPRRNHLTRIK